MGYNGFALQAPPLPSTMKRHGVDQRVFDPAAASRIPLHKGESMAVTVVCPSCNGKLSAPSQLLGRMAKCPQCGQTIKVAPSTDSPTAMPGPPPQLSSRKPRALLSESDAEEADHDATRPKRFAGQTEDFAKSPPSSRIALGLGIPSLILGMIAFLFSWIPLVGLLSMPLSGLGLVLGIAGLVVAIIQRGRGMGFPIAGFAVSLVALVIGVFWLGLLGAVFKGTETAVKQSGVQDIIAATGTGPSQEQDSVPPRKPSPEKETPWTDASKGGTQQGEIRVQLGGIVVRNVRIRDVLGEETVSPTKNLTIQVFIHNTSTTRKIDFQGWSGAGFNALALTDLLGGAGQSKANVTDTVAASGRNAASLKDNFDNPYKRVSLDLGAQIPGQVHAATSIYPGESVEDLLVFEPPIDKIQFLRLELPAAAFGGTGNLRLQIPKGMIRR
jgi:hypothetical protein